MTPEKCLDLVRVVLDITLIVLARAQLSSCHFVARSCELFAASHNACSNAVSTKMATRSSTEIMNSIHQQAQRVLTSLLNWLYTKLPSVLSYDGKRLSFQDEIKVSVSIKGKAKKKKKMPACPHPTDRLVRPDCKSFCLFVCFFNFFIKIQNYIIRKHCWNCQQSITHVRIGSWELHCLQDRIRHSLIIMNIISGVGNKVAKMADAMDTTDVCTFAIE